MTESKGRAYAYEGMFLVGQAAATDLNAVTDHLKQILGRAGAELISMRKWDERRLAYEIRKQKRGLYILTYFNCPADHIADLERECNLSETVLRAMFLRADHLTEEEMRNTDAQQDLAAESALRDSRDEEQAEPAAVAASDDD